MSEPGQDVDPDQTTEEPDASSGSVFGPLRRSRLRRIVGAQFLAEMGDGVSLVALPLYVWARTGSEVWTSLTFAAELGAGVVLAVVGGVLADAFDRQKVLLVSYLVRATLLTLAFAIDPLLIAVAFGVSARALGMADNPSFDALIPGHAKGDLQQVVALRRLVQAVSITIGPGIGALAVWLVGPRLALLGNVIAFLLAFVLLVGVRNADTDAAERLARLGSLPLRETVGDLLRGIAVVGRTPGVRRLLPYLALVMGTVGTLMASAVVFYERDLEAADYWYGLAIGAYGVGSAVGLGLAGSLTIRLPLPRIIVMATPFYAVACAIGAASSWPAVLAVSWLLWGILLGPELVATETFFLSRIPQEQRGRAFAGLNVATSLGMAIGSLVAAPVLNLFGAQWVILGTGVVVFTGIVFWIGPALQGAGWPGTEPVPGAPG
ncbi:MAG: MFS transporter [Actinomycetota bacterium]